MFITNIELLQKYMHLGAQEYYNGTSPDYAILP